MPVTTPPARKSISRKPLMINRQSTNADGQRRTPSATPEISDFTSYEELSTRWKEPSPLSLVSSWTSVTNSKAPQLSGSGVTNGSHSAPATPSTKPIMTPSTQRSRPVTKSPISGPFTKESRRSMIPLPTPDSTVRKHSAPSQHKYQIDDFDSTPCPPTRTLPKQPSTRGGVASWNVSIVEPDAPLRWIPPPPAVYIGKGKSPVVVRPSNRRWKRPALTAETFVPPIETPEFTMAGESVTPSFSIPCPRPNFRRDLERASPSPFPTTSPVSSKSLMPTPTPVSPTLTSSPLPPSPVSTTRALEFYNTPPHQSLQPTAAAEQVSTSPLFSHEPRKEAPPQHTKSSYHPCLPDGIPISDLESYDDSSCQSDEHTMRPESCEPGTFTTSGQECTLRRVNGQIVRFSDAGDGGPVEEVLVEAQASGENDIPREWEATPKGRVLQVEPPQTQCEDVKDQNQPVTYNSHAQEHLTPSQHLDAQRYDLLDRLGHNTFPPVAARPLTPYPREYRYKTLPARLSKAEDQLDTPISSIHKVRALELDALVAQIGEQSRASRAEKHSDIQTARSDAASGLSTNRTAHEASQEDVQPQMEKITTHFQPIMDSHIYQYGGSKVPEQELHGSYDIAPDRNDTMSPCETFYSAVSVLNLTENEISFTAPAKNHHSIPELAKNYTTITKPNQPDRSVTDQTANPLPTQSLTTNEYPLPQLPSHPAPTTPGRRSFTSHTSRDSRFHELMHNNGLAPYAARAQTRIRTQNLPPPSPLSLEPQLSREGANAARVAVTEVRCLSPEGSGGVTVGRSDDGRRDGGGVSGTYTTATATAGGGGGGGRRRFGISHRINLFKRNYRTWKAERKAKREFEQTFPKRRGWWRRVVGSYRK